MQHWLVKEYAKLVGNHLQIWSGSFTGRGGGGSWPSEATASGFEKKTGPKFPQFIIFRSYYPKNPPFCLLISSTRSKQRKKPLQTAMMGCHAPGAPGKGYLSAPFFQSPLNYLTRPWEGLEGPHRHMECLFVP